MTRVLFTWELGSNRGHLAQQLIVARELRLRGHDVLFAVCDIGIARSILFPEGFAFIQSPATIPLKPRGSECDHYAEILAELGFANQESLTSGIAAWQQLFALVKPAVIVATHAPLSLFAASLSSIPALHLALGFELPLDGDTLPVLRPWKNPDVQVAKRFEQGVLQNLSNVANQHGRPDVGKLVDIYRCDVTLFASIPELDHFPGRTAGRYIGPLLTWGEGARIEWRGEKPRKIFVYLRPHEGTVEILRYLGSIDAEVIAVIPGLSPELVKQLASSDVRILEQTVALRNVLFDADLVVSYAGHGMVACGLMAGVPMVLVPTNIEQKLCSDRVVSLGAGLALGTSELTIKFEATVTQVLTDIRFKLASRAVAEKYKQHDQTDVVTKLANTIERLPAARKRRQKSIARGLADRNPSNNEKPLAAPLSS